MKYVEEHNRAAPASQYSHIPLLAPPSHFFRGRDSLTRKHHFDTYSMGRSGRFATDAKSKCRPPSPPPYTEIGTELSILQLLLCNTLCLWAAVVETLPRNPALSCPASHVFGVIFRQGRTS